MLADYEVALQSSTKFSCCLELGREAVLGIVVTGNGFVVVIVSRREPTLIDDGSAEQEPALAALASAAVGGAAPAGPERRERPAIRLRDASGKRIASALSVGATVTLASPRQAQAASR